MRFLVVHEAHVRKSVDQTVDRWETPCLIRGTTIVLRQLWGTGCLCYRSNSFKRGPRTQVSLLIRRSYFKSWRLLSRVRSQTINGRGVCECNTGQVMLHVSNCSTTARDGAWTEHPIPSALAQATAEVRALENGPQLLRIETNPNLGNLSCQ